MRAFNNYKHESALDTCLYILKVQYVGSTYIKVRATLKNISNGIDYETATYTIHRNQLHLWKLV